MGRKLADYAMAFVIFSCGVILFGIGALLVRIAFTTVI